MTGAGMFRVFGDYRVRIDPWEVDYGDQTPLESLNDRPTEQVDHEVEVPDDAWKAIVPPARGSLRDRVVFIDGVRRLDARVQVRQDEDLIFGGFGSHAVGAAIMRDSAAAFGEIRVFRSMVLGAGRCLPSPVKVRDDLVYRAKSTPRTEADGPLRHIQNAMRTAEAAMAADLCDADTLVIVDGPLSFVPERPEQAVGYIKRLHDLYLPSRFLPLLATLPAGSRTPLFAIRGDRSGFSRYSWFQRLSDHRSWRRGTARSGPPGGGSVRGRRRGPPSGRRRHRLAARNRTATIQRPAVAAESPAHRGARTAAPCSTRRRAADPALDRNPGGKGGRA